MKLQLKNGSEVEGEFVRETENSVTISIQGQDVTYSNEWLVIEEEPYLDRLRNWMIRMPGSDPVLRDQWWREGFQEFITDEREKA